MNCNSGQLISTTNRAYQQEDLTTLKVMIPQVIEFIEYAIQEFESDKKMYANGGLHALRHVNTNVQNGVIGPNDQECFNGAVMFIVVHILLPNLKKTIPQTVKDAGLWDIGDE